MEKIWFISINDTVKGPMTAQGVDDELGKLPAASNPLVWWKGQSQWVTPGEWRKQREAVVREIQEAMGERQVFYVDLGEEPQGPYSLSQVGEVLKGVQSLDSVRLWSGEKKSWSSLFDLPHVCDKLGITRRNHPRVPLTGTAEISKDNIDLSVPVTSVSIGGFGIQMETPQVLSGVVSIKLRSPLLFKHIKTRAEVVYCKADGSVGFKFLSLSVESQAAIIEYVRAFESDKTAASSAA